MTILVSACLLGLRCRYDGHSKPNAAVLALGEKPTLIPCCPEQLGGLPTPRSPSEWQGDRIVNRAGEDVTAEYLRGGEEAVNLARTLGCGAAVLKERSPPAEAGRSTTAASPASSFPARAAPPKPCGLRASRSTGKASWTGY